MKQDQSQNIFTATFFMKPNGSSELSFNPNQVAQDDLLLMLLCYAAKLHWLLASEPEAVSELFSAVGSEIVGKMDEASDKSLLSLSNTAQAIQVKMADVSYTVPQGESFVIRFSKNKKGGFVTNDIPRPGMAANLGWHYWVLVDKAFLLLTSENQHRLKVSLTNLLDAMGARERAESLQELITVTELANTCYQSAFQNEQEKKPKVLMFEDEQMLRSMYETKFKMEGFEVASFGSPTKDPLSIILKEKPDVIVVDLAFKTNARLIEFLKSDPSVKGIPVINLANLEKVESNKKTPLGANDYERMQNHSPSKVIEKVKEMLIKRSGTSNEQGLEKRQHNGGNRSNNKIKILHFEDDQFLRNMFETKFQMLGFDFAGFDSPTKDPVSLVLKEKPDLIIMDIIMPISDGFTATEQLKGDDRTKNIPILGLCNLAQKADIEKAHSLGMADYFVSSQHTPTEIVKKVCQLLSIPVPKEKPIPPSGMESTPQKRSWWQFLR